MIQNQRPRARVHQSVAWLRTQSMRLLSGLGLTALEPHHVTAGRKTEREDEDQSRDASRDHRDERQEREQHDRASDQQTDEDPSAEASDANTRTDTTSDRNASRTEDGGRDDSERGSGRREDATQDADRASDDRSGTHAGDESDETGAGSGRRVENVEQSVPDEPSEVHVDEAPDPVSWEQTAPADGVNDLPETSEFDLVVEANEDVAAGVSTRPGVAFVRSGEVTVVTGPDGARVIRTDEPGVNDEPSGNTEGDGASITRADPSDAARVPRTDMVDTTETPEPSDDGGNNDLDFSS